METLFDNPDKYEEKYVKVDGYRTHYFEAGKGDPLVLVHGGDFMGALRWYPTIIPLSRRFHVYAPDELGHGYTDGPRNIEDLGHVRVRAEHIISFIETLKLGRVNLVGQSQGGWIVTYITLKRPDLVRKMVLIDSGSTSGSDARSGKRELLPYTSRIFEMGAERAGVWRLDMTTKEGMREYIQEFCYSTVNEEYLNRIMPIARRWYPKFQAVARERLNNPEAMRERAKQYIVDEKHISEYVKDITVPTLLIWGKQSNKLLEPGVKLFKRIPGAQMHIFDRANHFVWMDQPEDFNSLVIWFLTKD